MCSPAWKADSTCSSEWPIGCRADHVFTNVKTALTNVGILHWGESVDISKYAAYDMRGGPFAHVSLAITQHLYSTLHLERVKLP